MIQRGRNNKYPEKIEVWNQEMKKVPEWLSDAAKVEMVDLGTGNPILSMNKTSKGGVEILNASGSGVLIKTNNESDFICFGDSKMFVLTKKQVKLLYKDEKEKRGI